MMHLRRTLHFAVLAILVTGAGSALGQPANDYVGFVDSLLSKMTLEEKVGQMTQLTLDTLSSSAETDSSSHQLDARLLREAIVDRHVGSILNVYSSAFTLEHWQEVITAIQDVATKESARGIPILYGVDAVHGHNYMHTGTVFPQNIGMAATWNPELVRRANEITAIEMRAAGTPWNFSPVLDIGRQPMWSRFFETFGEDVFLVTEMGLAATDGLQGEDVGLPDRVAACAKHFLGYSLPLSGKDRTPAWIPDRELREYVLPSFREAIAAGIKTVMINSAEINGEPVHANPSILTDLLRDELGFEGVAVSDWEDIKKLHTAHKVASSQREAVRLAIEAGLDMSMVPYDYTFTDHLISLMRDGEIGEDRIDVSVRRILQLKWDLGLFGDPYPVDELASQVGSEEFAQVSLDAARESVTLLRNEEAVLPLAPTARILVTGPGASSLPAIYGAWSYTWQGMDEGVYPDTPTILDAMIDRFGIDRIAFVPGTAWQEEISIGAAVEEAFRSDVVMMVLGEPPSTEKPGDIDELDLPRIQIKLAEALAATGKPILLVLTENRPRIVREIVPLVDAVLLAYEPGPFGPQAIAEILAGDVNPSGRLPFTYPRFSGTIIPYDHKNAEKDDRNFGRNGFNPQWEFGEGLSYSSFRYEGLSLGSDTLSIDDDLEVSVLVTNQGSRPGKEVVQVYVRDEYASITPPNRRLRAFDKIDVEPASTVEVAFSIPVTDLAFVNADGEQVVEPGEFTVIVGDQERSFVVQ